MKNSKIASILRTFSKEEMKSFEKFINSPYFASRRNINSPFQQIKRYHPDFDISKQEFFRKLFPGEKFNEIKLKNLCSQLVNKAELFLINRSVASNESEAERSLATEYRNRNNDGLFFNTLKSLEKKIDSKLFNSIECFNEEEKLERLKEDFYGGRNEFNRSIAAKLNYSEHFTASFLIRFLRVLRDKIIIGYYKVPFESALLDSVYEIMDFDRLFKLLREKNYPLLWLIEIYYCVFKSSADLSDRQSYSGLKTVFYQNLDKFSRLEKFFLFNDMLDYCRRNENEGAFEFNREEFEIYKVMFAQNAFASRDDEYLSVVFYRNVILLGITLKEFDWLNSFIETYTSKLKPEFRDNMMNLAGANIFFEKGEFNKALDSISKVQYDFFLYKTDIRNLSLKIYYELGLYDAAYSLVDAFRHYLAETTELEELFKKQQYNFLNTYSRLLKAKSDGNMKDLEFLLEGLNKADNVASRKWLIQKGGELLK